MPLQFGQVLRRPRGRQRPDFRGENFIIYRIRKFSRTAYIVAGTPICHRLCRFGCNGPRFQTSETQVYEEASVQIFWV